jgi:nitrogen regulatory protein P-II 1
VKKVEAIIRTERLQFVGQALSDAGYTGMTVIEGRGRGTQKPMTMVWRGSTIRVDLQPKTKLEVVVQDDLVQPLVDIILASAYTGQAGDGKIIVSPIDEVIRIRTGEYGMKAIGLTASKPEMPAAVATAEPERHAVGAA